MGVGTYVVVNLDVFSSSGLRVNKVNSCCWANLGNHPQNVTYPREANVLQERRDVVKWASRGTKACTELTLMANWCINWVLMRVIDAVRETIADVSSASPSSEPFLQSSKRQLLPPSRRLLPSSTLSWYTSLSSAAPTQLPSSLKSWQYTYSHGLGNPLEGQVTVAWRVPLIAVAHTGGDVIKPEVTVVTVHPVWSGSACIALLDLYKSRTNTTVCNVLIWIDRFSRIVGMLSNCKRTQSIESRFFLCIGPFTHVIFDAISRTKRAWPYPARLLFSCEASRGLERKLSHIIWRHPSFQFLLTWRYFVAALRDWKPVRGRLGQVL